MLGQPWEGEVEVEVEVSQLEREVAEMEEVMRKRAWGRERRTENGRTEAGR